MNEVQKKRDSNLELFRIITMILIVAHHYVVNSGLTADGGPIYSNLLSKHSIFLLLLGAWGKIGINCFVLITGYFMCKLNITAKKFAKLFCEIMFYNLVINAVFWISGYEPFSFIGLLKALIPIKEISTDFTGTYLIFFLFIPFLNILVQKMNEKQHLRILLLCAFTYVFLGTFHRVAMNYVSWFMVLYLISSYIRLYDKKIYANKKFWAIAMIGSVCLSICSVICCTFVYTKFGRITPYIFVTDSNTFLALLTALCSFMFFKNITIKYNKVINAFGASTFGVLLIHANSDTMRQWLWRDTLNNVGAYSYSWGYMHAILSVIVIFLVCSLLDMLRIRFIEKPFFVLWDKKWNGVLKKWNDFEGRICKRFNIGE